jgi:hypothetical protein
MSAYCVAALIRAGLSARIVDDGDDLALEKGLSLTDEPFVYYRLSTVDIRKVRGAFAGSPR